MSLVLLLYIIGLILIAGATYFFFGSFLYGAGYQPTPRKVALKMIEMGEIVPADLVMDLGAGTGGLLLMAAEMKGATVTGIEVEPLRIVVLRLRRLMSPARKRISIKRSDFFKEDLGSTTVILAFLWPSAMERLKPKLERELRPGCRLVSYWHPVPGWTPDRVDRGLRIYFYRWSPPGNTPVPPSPSAK
jgi:SAM-dependent methyltransferase